MFTLKFWKKLATQIVAMAAGAAVGLVEPVIAGDVSYSDAGKVILGVVLSVLLKGLAASFVGDPTDPNLSGNKAPVVTGDDPEDPR